MNKMQILTSVSNGIFKRNRNLVLNAIKSFEGKDVLISFEKPKKKRSNNQNSFYWGVVLPIVQQGLFDLSGEVRSVDNIHYNILLPLFAPINEIVNADTGQVCSEKISSSDMTTVEFMEYILDIQKWSAEFLGVDVPDPNEENLLNFD